jgi:hypothetical protein
MRWGIGAAIAFLLAIGVIQASGEFPVMAKTGLAQLLRQSAWEQALAGQSEQKPWPWEDTTFVPGAKVPRLGLSAAVLTEASGGGAVRPMPGTRRAGLKPGQKPTELGDVAIGDSITVTGADGSSHIFKVTGRRVVDPHLAESDETAVGGGDALTTCWALNGLVGSSLRLVIQATQVEPPSAPQQSAEQKL